MTSPRLFLFIAVSIVLSSCTTTVQAPLSNVSVKGGNGVPEQGAAELQSQSASEAEMDMEGVVSKGCLAAWRKALKGDEKGSLAILDDLSKKYPSVTTVVFMKGQVLDHLGKKKEAIEFYKKAVGPKEFSTLHIFKLAEDLRQTNQNQDAIVQYRRLIKLAPDFAPGHVGLAKSLFATDKNSAEGNKELDSVVASAKSELDADPNSADARECLNSVLQARPDNTEAKKLLDKMGPSADAGKTAASTKAQ